MKRNILSSLSFFSCFHIDIFGCMMTLTFMVVVADVADYKAMCLGWAGLGVIYQGGDTRAV